MKNAGERQNSGLGLRRGDWILILSVLVLALGAFGWMRWNRQSGSFFVVEIDGRRYASYESTQDRTEVIPGYEGGSNTLVIQDGKARVLEADCPDGTCIHQGEISYQGQTIVCLPHRIVISVEGGGSGAPDIDAVAQ